MQISRAAAFQSLHAPGEFLSIPNAWDAASAKIFEASGAKAIATTSCAVAWALGFADGEKISLDALTTVVRGITRSVSIPVSVDFERGYGETPNDVAASVTRILDVGAVGINLEDGFGPANELGVRIAVARRAALRFGVPLFINARTDVVLHRTRRPEQEVDEILARAKIYQDAGADGLFVPGLSNPDHIEAVARGTSLPLNLFAALPKLPPVAELRRLGVRRLTTAGRFAEVAFDAARRACIEFLESGTYSAFERCELNYHVMNGFFAKP
ncbi:isocitrate lyase/phosphoenolpyruvate mutase family protein [Pendulispora rubella]|uniref:Isocitrate lyase/phosphoenolpyruvate mutase family protein n=1 Tax=Pendulispora rubella TaxID=2741070 RepID=A0ABZ2LDY9_9BACT